MHLVVRGNEYEVCGGLLRQAGHGEVYEPVCNGDRSRRVRSALRSFSMMVWVTSGEVGGTVYQFHESCATTLTQNDPVTCRQDAAFGPYLVTATEWLFCMLMTCACKSL